MDTNTQFGLNALTQARANQGLYNNLNFSNLDWGGASQEDVKKSILQNMLFQTAGVPMDMGLNPESVRNAILSNRSRAAFPAIDLAIPGTPTGQFREEEIVNEKGVKKKVNTPIEWSKDPIQRLMQIESTREVMNPLKRAELEMNAIKMRKEIEAMETKPLEDAGKTLNDQLKFYNEAIVSKNMNSDQALQMLGNITKANESLNSMYRNKGYKNPFDNSQQILGLYENLKNQLPESDIVGRGRIDKHADNYVKSSQINPLLKIEYFGKRVKDPNISLQERASVANIMFKGLLTIKSTLDKVPANQRDENWEYLKNSYISAWTDASSYLYKLIPALANSYPEAAAKSLEQLPNKSKVRNPFKFFQYIDEFQPKPKREIFGYRF